MKKLIMILMTFVAMLSISTTASALTDGDWEFKLLDNEVTITGYNGTETNLVIPSHIYNTPVTAIEANHMFEDVVSITFPSTIKTIPSELFGANNGNHANLETVILPEGIEVIEDGAFAYCSSLKNITLPSTLTTIESAGTWNPGAFAGCKSLTSINIPQNLTKLGVEAFKNSGLKSVDLSPATGLTTIGADAFSGCEFLEDITLNYGLKTLGVEAFADCTALKKINFSGTEEELGSYAFWGCTALEEIILPTSLKTIQKFAFVDCEALKEVVIPYGTKKLDYGAFQSCSSLESLYIPDTVTELPNSTLINGSDNCIIYCTANSAVESFCKKAKHSYLTDSSVNSGITVLYKGRRISFHSYGQNPQLVNDRTLVPLRSIFEAMGAEVEWIGETSTVIATRNDVKVTLQIGSNTVVKNNENITIDTPPMILNDRTMVPVRVIAEAFGADVQWHNAGRTVIITE